METYVKSKSGNKQIDQDGETIGHLLKLVTGLDDDVDKTQARMRQFLQG